MAERGCGKRMAGGIYFECRLSPYGKPVEDFLYCPPLPVPESWGLSPVSSRLVGRDVADWIGQSHYHNVLDYIEEIRSFGLSGRLPRNFPFHKLTTFSRFLPVHARAIIDNWRDLVALMRRGKREASCPHNVHDGHDGYCAGMWWEDVDLGEECPEALWRWSRPVRREMPAFSYYGNAPVDGLAPVYVPGVLGAFPLGRLVVVAGADAEDIYDRLSATVSVPLSLVEE